MVDGDPRKAGLEQYRESLGRQIVAAYTQLGMTTNQADKVPIQNQIEHYERELEAVEKKLQAFMPPAGEAQQRYRKFDAHIHKIDFSEAMAAFKSIMAQFGDAGGAALFLVQNSSQMCGKLCVSQFKEFLQDQTGDWKHYPVSFSVEKTANEWGLLEGLARHLGIMHDADSLEQYARQILHTLCGSVRSGSVVFVEINQWDVLATPEEALKQFLEVFWLPLVNHLPGLVQQKQCRRVKFIAVITADMPLPFSPEDYDLLCCCPASGLLAEKAIDVALRWWTREEIQTWLDMFSGLDSQEVDRLVPQIYHISGQGMPRMVYEFLKDKFA